MGFISTTHRFLSTFHKLHTSNAYYMSSVCPSLHRMYSKTKDELYPLTKVEAISYLENTLKITNWQSILTENPLSFLTVVSTHTKLCIPYTNLPFFVKDGIKNPTFLDGKELMLKGLGGNCFIINPFMEAVFNLLGLQTNCVTAKVFHWGNADFFGHVGIIVRNLTSAGDLHIVDPGSPFATLEAVPLTFDTASATYGTPGFRYKYFMVNQGFVQLCQKVDLSHLSKLGTGRCQFFYQDNDYWKVLYTYNILGRQSPSYFFGVNQVFCDDINVAPELHTELVLSGYPNSTMVNIKRRKCIAIEKNGKVNVTKIKDTAQLVETIQQYFPQYSNKELEFPMKHFENQN